MRVWSFFHQLGFVLILLAVAGSVSAEEGDGKIFGRVYKATEEISFHERKYSVSDLGSDCRIPFLGDFTGDGEPELFVACRSGELKIFRRTESRFERAWSVTLPKANFHLAGILPVETEGGVSFIAFDRGSDPLLNILTFRDDQISARTITAHSANLSPYGIVTVSERHSLRSKLRFVVASAPGMAFEFSDLKSEAGFRSYSLHDLGSENVRLAGLVDRFGVGVPELAFRREESLIAFRCPLPKSRFCPPDVELLTWAEIPHGSEPAQVVSGDFDGDGREDTLSYRPGISGWWLAISNGQSGIETEIRGLPKFGPGSRLFALDRNRDGLSEIAVFDGDQKSISVFERSNLIPEIGTKLHLDASAGQKTAEQETNEEGYFEFSGLPAGTYTLRVQAEGGTFSRETIKVRLYQRESRAENFLSYPPDEPYRAVTRSGRARGPFVCNGYLPSSEGSKWAATIAYCPNGYALIAVDDGERYPKHKTLHRGNCCRLPADDVLNGEFELRVDNQCPDQSIATGFDNSLIPSKLRCSKLSEKYSLGPKTPARYWGYGYAYSKGGPAKHRDEFPLSVRYAVGREGYFRWMGDGCTGSPIGAFAVSGPNKECKDVFFRQLLRRSENGIESSPVTIFPDCRSGADSFLPGSSCRD